MPYTDREKANENGRKNYAKQMLDPEKKAARAKRSADYMRKWYAKHRDRFYSDPVWTANRRKNKREWAREHPECGRKARLKQLYGLSYDAYKTMCNTQQGLCAICKKVMDIPHVDHCHTTGKIRGLLCKSCNTGIGMFQESLEILDSAKEYLTRWV